jgi:hypothetical protein
MIYDNYNKQFLHIYHIFKMERDKIMRNKKKKITILISSIMTIVIIISFSACSSNKTPNNSVTTMVTVSDKKASAIMESQSSADSQTTAVSQSAATGESSNDVAVKSIDGIESVSVPTGWNTDDRTDWSSADITISNVDENEYFVMIKQPKSDYPDGYTVGSFIDNDVKGVINKLLKDSVWSDTAETKINNLDGLKIQLNGTGMLSKIKTVYWITVVEDDDNFYEMFGYTYASNEDANKPVIESITNSFIVNS